VELTNFASFLSFDYQLIPFNALRCKRQRIFPVENLLLIHILIAITGILLLIYALLIFYYHRQWEQIPVFAVPSGHIPHPPVKISVIIPARNEALRITHCLDSLLQQTYPASLTEIIIVNDFSTDQTAALVSAHPLKSTLLNLADFVSDNLNAYKKKAIETGIASSSGELIICTDADCSMGPDWLCTFVTVYQQANPEFIAAPVKIIPNGSALSVFQTLDFISLQGITGAAVYKNLYPMCNGANLAYTRKAYNTVDGFKNIDHIASGDDMLLMKKIQAGFPGKATYMKDPGAIVSTGPAENIRAFFSQRIRWASKISHYKHPATFITLAGVYLVNVFLLILFISCFFYGHWRWLILLLAFKTISEYFFVSKVARFFQQQSLMKYFAICQPFHILYTVIAGSFGSFGKYEWKNRKIK
jgi:cellulose synthase/poly-beta-1,6-N-acetylglucosamine synthase-like glycosyltransferase